MERIERKFVSFEFDTKSENDLSEGIIAGYGSVFSNVDLAKDIVLPTAFDKSLASGRKVKMYFQHNMAEPIGVWTDIRVDQRGLRVEGKLADTVRGRDIKELLRLKAVEGLSIGYRVLESEFDSKGNKLLKSVDLVEVSIVDNPCNTEALIDTMKSENLETEVTDETTEDETSSDLLSAKDLEAKLRDVVKLSRKQAKALLSGGYKAYSTPRDAELNDETDNSETEAKAIAEIVEAIKATTASLRQ